MNEKLRYVGLDVHKKVVEACFLDPRGGLLKRERFDLTRESLAEFARTKLQDSDQVALEATTNSWSVVRVLKEQKISSVFVSNPLQTKAIASAKLKSDKVDAEMLAQLLRCDFLPLVWQPDEETQDLRSITSRRVSLVHQRTAVKNRIQATLHQRLIRVPDGFRDLFGKQGLAWLDSILPEFPALDRMAIESELRLLESFKKEIRALDDELHRRGNEDERLKILVTLPGVDVVVAQTILAVLGDISRFSSADKAASYFGLTPRNRQSAFTQHHGRITKAGSSHARWLMVQAAWSACRSPVGPLAGFYRKLLKKKNHNVAVVAVARKLVVYAWHMLKNREPYRYAHPGTAARKLGHLRRRGGGSPRKGKPGVYTMPFSTKTERVLPSLPDVYEAADIPPAREFDELPEGEQKVIRKQRRVRETRALQKIQRKAKEPATKRLEGKDGANAA